MARVRVPIQKDAESRPSPAVKEEVSAQMAPENSIIIFIKNNIKLLIVAGIAVIVIILLASLINDRNQLKNEVDQLKSADSGQTTKSNQQQEAAQLKQKIGQYIQLPADEEPTVATVVDADRVKSQSFFKDSQNGDKVLLFAKAGKAILYRPDTDKVIEVAPINQNSKNLLNQAQQTPQN